MKIVLIALGLLFVGAWRVSAFFDPERERIGEIEFQAEALAGWDRPILKGRLPVFEDNIQNRGPKIELAIAVLPAARPEPDKEPLFYIAGGPGTAASDYIANFIVIAFAEILQTRPIVVVDQRGAGGSNPLKADTAHYQRVQDYLTPTIDVAVARASRPLYEKRGNLRFYTSLNAVLDLEAVRRAMGYERVSFYATSYGVRPALIYINRFPERVRAAILKGVVPPEAAIPVPFARDAQQALEKLAQRCAEDPACASAFPDFREDFDRVLAQLEKEPVKVSLKHPRTGAVEEALFTRSLFSHLMRSCLMDTGLASQLPYWIHRARDGDFQPLAELSLRIRGFYVQRFYEGMSLCVICQEDLPRFAQLDLNAEVAGTFLKRDWIDPALEACHALGLTDAPPPDYLDPGLQQTPVLFISGGMDGATPPRYGENVLKWFPNGRHLVAPNGGHSFRGMMGCVDHIMARFIESGSAAKLETECAAEIPFPPFKITD